MLKSQSPKSRFTPYRAGQDPSQPGRYLHGHMLATKDTYEGRGIGKTLSKMLLEEAGRRGFLGVVVEASVPASQGLFSKLGGNVVASLVYKDFEYQGGHPYAHVEGDTKFMIVPCQNDF